MVYTLAAKWETGTCSATHNLLTQYVNRQWHSWIVRTLVMIPLLEVASRLHFRSLQKDRPRFHLNSSLLPPSLQDFVNTHHLPRSVFKANVTVMYPCIPTIFRYHLVHSKEHCLWNLRDGLDSRPNVPCAICAPTKATKSFGGSKCPSKLQDKQLLFLVAIPAQPLASTAACHASSLLPCRAASILTTISVDKEH